MRGLFIKLPHTSPPSFLPEAFPQAITSICWRSRLKHSAACVKMTTQHRSAPNGICHSTVAKQVAATLDFPSVYSFCLFTDKKPTKRESKFYTLGRSRCTCIYIYILNLQHFWHSKIQSTLWTFIGPLMMSHWRIFVVLWELVRWTSAEGGKTSYFIRAVWSKGLVHELLPKTWTSEDISVLVGHPFKLVDLPLSFVVS